jgi:hypothetical protein
MTNTWTTTVCNPVTNLNEEIIFTRNFIRYTPPNPYTVINAPSIFDHNMRRKAEILQYKKNMVKDSSNTQNAEWSRIVRSKRFNNRAAACTSKIIYKPSSASNVPGKMPLYLNSSVPLYRYGAPLRSYLTN